MHRRSESKSAVLQKYDPRRPELVARISLLRHVPVIIFQMLLPSDPVLEQHPQPRLAEADERVHRRQRNDGGGKRFH
ncbi:MAG: hypothetical protein WHT46_07660, partial [Candidatus Geothermincolales bacterium]